MKLATLCVQNAGTKASYAIEDNWHTLPFSDVAELLCQDNWRESLPKWLEHDDSEVIPASNANYAPLVITSSKVICCGLNYRSHIQEMGREMPQWPTLFAKYSDTLAGNNDALIFPSYAQDIDWEAELAVVVGSTAYQITPDTAHMVIAGYTVANDLSVRSWQKRTLQWFQGKNFAKTTPIGPWILTADEFDPSLDYTISLQVNGKIRQQATINDLLFSPADLVAYISQFTALHAGDIILTGTPGGVASGKNLPDFLQDGDQIITKIQGLGSLTNTIILDKGR